MSAQMEMHYCQSCGFETNHVLVLVRKKSEFEKMKHRRLREFVAGLVKGWAVGPFIASMDDLSRHLICEKCGTKIVED